MSEDSRLIVFFNASCSKCRSVRQTLEEKRADAAYVHYLDDVPARAQLEDVARKLGVASPRAMMRTGEPIYGELGLENASDERLFEAMVAHPILIERPIVIRGDAAVIARPPERVLELL